MPDAADDPTQIDVPPVDPTQVAVPVVDPGAGAPPPLEPPLAYEGGEPPDRRPWIIAAILAVIAIVAVALLLTSDDDEPTAATSTTISEETTTSESTTTTEATTTSESTTTTTTVAEAPPVTADPAQCAEAGADPGDPAPAAQAVFQAWTRGDEACAHELMTDDAFDELFARDGTDAQDDFQGCTEADQPDPAMDCAFTYEGGATHYLMSFSPTDGWLVTDIQQVAD